MDLIQASTLILLGVFYIAYFAKALMLKRQGINVDLLGKGDKPKGARLIERCLRVATFTGAAIQFGSAALHGLVCSVSATTAVRGIGVILMLAGSLFFIIAMLIMRENWRAGFDRSQNTSLVTRGIYSLSRNPAFVGFDLVYIGCAAAFPNVINIAMALAAIMLFHAQIVNEEKYCEETFGEKYLQYKTKTRRYL